MSDFEEFTSEATHILDDLEEVLQKSKALPSDERLDFLEKIPKRIDMVTDNIKSAEIEIAMMTPDEQARSREIIKGINNRVTLIQAEVKSDKQQIFTDNN